jgi:glycosyltransferase involved in cell wall biosynthesis
MAKTINSFKYRLSVLLGQARIERNGSVRVYAYKKYLYKSNRKPKKALVSYLVNPVIDELSGIQTSLFSNNGAGRTIPKVLNELGYTVDVVNWDDTRPIAGEYDLVVFHGGKNFDQIKNLRTKQNKLLYYSTGSYWKHHNYQEKKRYEDFNYRHNSDLAPDRKIDNSEEESNAFSDMIVSLGNKETAKTYNKFKNVKYLHAASVTESRKVLTGTKKYSEAKKNFLFMSGPGGIHKGLDWAIDYFLKKPNLNLHIMMSLEEDFKKYYSKALYGSRNIHYYGYVEQRSKNYYQVVDKCASSILLSCSEGSPGSVIESMHQGLIPIVTKESHIDVKSCGIIIDSLNFKELDKAITSIVNLSDHKLLEISEKTIKLVEDEYRVDQFEEKLQSIIKSFEMEKK